MQKHFIFYLILIFSIFIACNNNSTSVNSIDPVSEELLQVYKKAENITYIRSLLVQKDGVLMGEKYFNANSNTKFDVRSVTKSFVGILTGIAIEKGYLQSIDQKLSEFFPGITDKTADITIENLLTMTAGFEGDEFISMQYYMDWAYSGIPLNYVLDSNMKYTPGNEFHYYSAVPYIMGQIIEKVYGKSLYAFAQEYLFVPMNFDQPDWETLIGGSYNGGAGLQLTARDMIKFGQMILDGGVYNGIRIVSKEWIDESTQRHYNTNLNYEYEKQYGYYWWILPKFDKHVFFANGYGGNFIFCVPEKNLIVTASSEWQSISQSSASQNWVRVSRLIVEDILPLYINE